MTTKTTTTTPAVPLLAAEPPNKMSIASGSPATGSKYRRKLEGKEPARYDESQQQPAATTSASISNIYNHTRVPLHPENGKSSGISSEVAYRLLQDIKKRKLAKERNEIDEHHASAYALLDQHFSKHFIDKQLPATSASNFKRSTPQPPTSYKTVCKYVHFDRHHKVDDDTYVIKLKSNKLADLKQSLPTFANPNYRFFLRNQQNQLEQIFNDDQQLCTIKDKNGQDVIFCEIVIPNLL